MATRDTGDQKRVSRTQDEVEETSSDAADVAARKEQLDADVDAILDEIDDVLEENAEDFVKSFVQKGGQ
jgi:prokaryotic ubiquitin-like protein Pup